MEAPRSPAAPSTYARQSAEATHRPPLRLRGPQRERVSSSDPTPQPPVRFADPGALGCSFVSGVPPPRPGPTAGAVARVVPQSTTAASPAHPHREAGKGSERVSGSLPRPASGGQLVGGRSSRLGIPEFITGLCVANLKLSLREPPSRAAECCSSRKFREAGGREAGGRRSRRPG